MLPLESAMFVGAAHAESTLTKKFAPVVSIGCRVVSPPFGVGVSGPHTCDTRVMPPLDDTAGGVEGGVLLIIKEMVAANADPFRDAVMVAV